jgi:hypothetical protein
MSFWDTEEAGFFATAILVNEDDLFCKDILIDKTYKYCLLPNNKKFRNFQKVGASSEQRHLYLEAKIPSLSQGEK